MHIWSRAACKRFPAAVAPVRETV